jgi:hypothetical protein
MGAGTSSSVSSTTTNRSTTSSSSYGVSSTTPTNSNSSATPANPRDTLHLSNPFVAAVNMQPWTSLLAGVGDSANTSMNASANVQAARGGAVSGSASVNETKPATTTTATTTTTTTTASTPMTSDFDRKYIDYQVNFHQQVLDALDSRLIPWASPELRSMLEETRPKIQAHLDRARELQRTLQSNASNY